MAMALFDDCSPPSSPLGGPLGVSTFACSCVGCAGPASAPPASWLKVCARTEALPVAAASLIIPPFADRGALLLGSIDAATAPSACIEALQGAGQVSLIVQCAREHAGRARPAFARRSVPVEVLELRLEDVEGFTGAPPSFAAGSGARQDLAAALAAALPRIEAERAAGRHVLVSCAMGRSRSAAVVLAHLVTAERRRLDEALALVRRARPCADPNRGFLMQLMRLEAESAGGGGGVGCSSVPEAVVLQLLVGGRACAGPEEEAWRGRFVEELRHFVARGASEGQRAAAAAAEREEEARRRLGGEGGGDAA